MSKPIDAEYLPIDNWIELHIYGQTTYGNYTYRLIQTDYKTYGKSILEDRLGKNDKKQK